MLLQSGCEWGYKLGDKAFHELLVTPNPMTLTETKVHDAQFGIRPDGTVTAKAYKLGDAGGLYLEVPPSGRKRWRLKYRFAGKERRLALGLYPDISLDEARRRRDAARELLAAGVDPGEQAKFARAAVRDEQARQLAATRFFVDSDGSLSFRLGKRCLGLTPEETAELLAFLDATRSVIQKR